MLSKMNDKFFLKTVRKIAKMQGYDPSKLYISQDGIHKLEYHLDNNKKIKFGRVGYMDFPNYLYNVVLNNITLQDAIKKRINYRKRAIKVLNKINNDFSPSALSYKILW